MAKKKVKNGNEVIGFDVHFRTVKQPSGTFAYLLSYSVNTLDFENGKSGEMVFQTFNDMTDFLYGIRPVEVE